MPLTWGHPRQGLLLPEQAAAVCKAGSVMHSVQVPVLYKCTSVALPDLALLPHACAQDELARKRVRCRAALSCASVGSPLLRRGDVS
jgi:hypothetical protein